jgi:hypothetical protein
LPFGLAQTTIGIEERRVVVVIDPTEHKDRHCKVYIEESLYKAIKDYQYKNGIYSFSEAGRRLWLKALEQYGFEK